MLFDRSHKRFARIFAHQPQQLGMTCYVRRPSEQVFHATAYTINGVGAGTEMDQNLGGVDVLSAFGCSYPVAVARHLVRYVFVQTAESLVPKAK
jgi:hypothetical protein